jgi:transposase InsO family protein
VNSTLTEYFSELGVIHIITAPFCREMNGKAEREMRTLKDTARAMLCQAKFLWAEEMACTVYIHNRILNKQSKDVTAYERILNNAPSIHHVRVFLCKTHA